MELSFAHRFVFIHVPKTGGESVVEALRPFSDDPPVPPGGRTPVIRKLYVNALYQLRERRYGHITAKELQAAMPGEFFATAFKFAFVRNPWDWHVSTYHYVVQQPEHEDHARYVALGSFEAYLEHRAAEGAALQSDYVLGDDGELLVDFVGRQEALAGHFALACERIGIRASLPHVNRSSHRDFRSYYSPRTRDLVAELCRRDIEAFGYEFDPQPALAPIERIPA
ncbi:MAG TPA: sulfotransferase family 2 domain-containing protein [Solirubrobacteraceae bacterium]|nr:sulfotransferase family 2 domain-containing protein [Solirubrobacteraceae bacterium]